MSEIIKNIEEWEVMTPSGWSDFYGIKQIQKSNYIHIKCTGQKELKCSTNHNIKLHNGEWISASNLSIGDILVDGYEVNEIIEIFDDVELYDLLNVENGNEYYTNDILSHNCAFIEYIDEIWGASQQTLATGGKCIALSTPNGMGNWFHQMWVGSKEGANRFNPINLHWSLHPDRDQEWRDQQDKILGAKLAAQECDTDFISSGHTVIEGEVLKWYQENHVKKPIEKRGRDSNIWLWEYPDYSQDYLITADVARGDGKDYSAFHIMEVESMRQIGSYKGKIETKDYGRLLNTIGREYNNALVVVENANIGWAVLQELIDLDYPNLFYSSRDMQVVDVHYTHINRDMRGIDNPTIPGFTTSSKTRPMLISKLDEYVRTKQVQIQDERLIDELFTFIWQGQRAEAMKGYNDDMVISYAIALWVRDTALRLRQEGIEMTKQTLNHMGKSQVVYSSGTPNGEDPYKQVVNGEEIDLRWLFG